MVSSLVFNMQNSSWANVERVISTILSIVYEKCKSQFTVDTVVIVFSESMKFESRDKKRHIPVMQRYTHYMIFWCVNKLRRYFVYFYF